MAELRVIGLDLSLEDTGIALLVGSPDRRALNALKARDRRGGERLDWYWERIGDALTEGRPDLVAIEGYAYGAPNSMAAIGELGGIVRLLLHQRSIPAVIIPPPTWRKKALGRGNLAKDQVRLELARRYRLEHPDMNALEAYAVAVSALLTATGQEMPPIRRARVA